MLVIKKHNVIIPFLIVLISSCFLLQGCNKQVDTHESDKASTTSTAIQNNSEKIDYDNVDVHNFFMLHRDELQDKYGNDYEEMQIGPEGYYEGYYYKKLGLTFGYSNNLLEYIKCDNEVWINGIKNGMSFKEIQQKLGESTIKQDDTEDSFYWMLYDFDGYTVEIDSNDKEGNNSLISISRNVKLIETTEESIRNYFNINEDDLLNNMNGMYYDIVDDAGLGNDERGYYFEELSLVFIFNSNRALETVEPRDVFYFKGEKIKPTFESVESALGEPTEEKIINDEKNVKEISFIYNGFIIKCISANGNSPFCRMFIYKTDN